MNDDSKVRPALIQAALTFLTDSASITTESGVVDGLPFIAADSIQWENREFDATGKKVWAAVFYRPNAPTARTIGRGGIDEINGFLQIDINVEPNEGEEKHEAWNHKARLFFESGRGFVHDAHSVLVISCGMSQGRHVENFFRKSITVGFKSQLKRPQTTTP